MSDARPGTRMTVADWSGRRMLATRGWAGLGPEAWGLLRRLALREGFGGIAARWEGPRLLASGIAESLAGWITGARARPWDFLADAPEGEVLALWTPAAEGEVAPPVGRRKRPGLFPARTGVPRMALRPVRPRRVAGLTFADRAVSGPSSSRPAPWRAGSVHGGPGLPSRTAITGASGGPLLAVLGPRITEVGADLAAEVLGFVRLRSGVPMGTAGTPEAGPTRGGLLRTVDLAGSRETRIEAGGGPEWPRDSVSLLGKDPGVPRGDPGPGFARGHRVVQVSGRVIGGPMGLLLARQPRETGAPSQGQGDVTSTPPWGRERLLASVSGPGRTRDLGPWGGAPDSPEAVFLSFHRQAFTGHEAVFPERVATTREVAPPESRTTRRSGRALQRSARGDVAPRAAREAGSAPASPEGFVARATFTPRRAHAVAPWFAPPAHPAPVFGRSLWSAAMGPTWPGEPTRAAGPEWGPWLTAEHGVGPARAGLLGSREVLFASPGGLRAGVFGWPEPGAVAAMGSSLARLAAAARTASMEDAALIRLSGASVTPFSVTDAGLGPGPADAGKVYPERAVSRTGAAATVGDIASAPGLAAASATTGSGIRTATFSPRRAGVVEAPGASPDHRMADEVLATLGMKALARGKAVGAGAPVSAPWTGWVPEGPRIAVTETMLSRAGRGGFAPWAFAGAGELAFLALPGAVRSEAGTPPEGIATSGPPIHRASHRDALQRRHRPPDDGSRPSLPLVVQAGAGASPRASRWEMGHRSPVGGIRVTTTPWPGGTTAARIAGTGLAEPGPYGTTPLARLMALGTGTVRAGRGRTEGTGGASEAGVWMLDGLLRLGLRGDDARPEASRVAGRGSAAETGPRPGAGGERGTAFAGSRGERESVASREGARGSRGERRALTGRYGETLVTRTLAPREVPGPGTVGAASRPTSRAVDVARADGPTPWGFAGGLDEVFLRFPVAVSDRPMVSMTRFGAANSSSRPPLDLHSAAGEPASNRSRELQFAATPRPPSGSRRSHPETARDGLTGWGGPATFAGDEATLLVMARPPEREGREAAGWIGSRGGTGAIPAGAMWFIQRTLGRALRALPPEAWDEAGPRAVESGLVPADLAGLLGIVPAMSREVRAETAEAGHRSERAGRAVGDLVSPPGTGATAGDIRTVRPERIEARTPGLPEELVTLEMSLGDTGPAGPVVGPGTAPSLSGLIRAGETPGPALRGLPLVAPAVSAVANQAMMSRRSESPAARPTRTPDAQAPAAGSQAAGSQPIDLDVLAIEMAERILRRMKRDKERRGHHD